MSATPSSNLSLTNSIDSSLINVDSIVVADVWPYSDAVVPLKELERVLGTKLKRLDDGTIIRCSLHCVEGEGGLDQGKGGDGGHRDILRSK